MAHPSKRKSLFPGGSAFQQALEIPQNRSLRPSPELPPSRSTGRHDPPLIESSRRHPQNAKGREDYRQRKQELIPVKKESPWNTYTDKYGLRLGEWVKVAGKKPSTGEIFAVRSISKSNTEKGLCQIRKLCHENLLTVHEIFDFDSSFYIVSERMHITLDDVIASPAYPEEAELASIIWQLLAGITFLISQNMVHGKITCSSVFANKDGDVKIANLECCQHVAQDDPERMKDLKAIGPILVGIMEKRYVENGKIGLEDTRPWSDVTVDFVSRTASSPSLKELSTDTFLEGPPKKKELVLFFDLIISSVLLSASSPPVPLTTSFLRA